MRDSDGLGLLAVGSLEPSSRIGLVVSVLLLILGGAALWFGPLDVGWVSSGAPSFASAVGACVLAV